MKRFSSGMSNPPKDSDRGFSMYMGKAPIPRCWRRWPVRFLHVYGEGTRGRRRNGFLGSFFPFIWEGTGLPEAAAFISAVSHVYGEDSFLQGAAIVCGCFIFTARWKCSLFLQFSHWRNPPLTHFAGYSFEASSKKVSTIFWAVSQFDIQLIEIIKIILCNLKIV